MKFQVSVVPTIVHTPVTLKEIRNLPEGDPVTHSEAGIWYRFSRTLAQCPGRDSLVWPYRRSSHSSTLMRVWYRNSPPPVRYPGKVVDETDLRRSDRTLVLPVIRGHTRYDESLASVLLDPDIMFRQSPRCRPWLQSPGQYVRVHSYWRESRSPPTKTTVLVPVYSDIDSGVPLSGKDIDLSAHVSHLDGGHPSRQENFLRRLQKSKWSKGWV